jgi:choice-of-anchor C domain-containing protein
MHVVNKVAAWVAWSAVAVGTAHAAPFQNGSFEVGTSDPGAGFVTLAAGNTSITGWTVTGNGVDYIGGLWQAAEGSRSVDMSAGNAGGIQQSFDTVAGHTYRVRFDLAGNPQGAPTAKTLQVQATGGTPVSYTFDTTGHSTGSMGWATQTYTFTATGLATTLSFVSQDATAFGPALDNVVVSDVTPTPVPTLSQWGLVGLAGLLGLFALRVRRTTVRRG